MPKRIFFDIETLPPTEAERDFYRSEYTRFSSVAKTTDLPSFEQYFRDLAFEAATGRLLTIGLIIDANGETVQRGCLGRERETGRFHLDEARTLRSFWSLIKNFDLNRDLIIGHNVTDFDLLFLQRRSAILNVAPSLGIPLNKYRSAPVFDTMWEWTRGQRKIRLELLARQLNLPNPKCDDLDGSKIYDAFQAGRDHEIAAYCLRDAECVRQVYYRMTFTTPPDNCAPQLILPAQPIQLSELPC